MIFTQCPRCDLPVIVRRANCASRDQSLNGFGQVMGEITLHDDARLGIGGEILFQCFDAPPHHPHWTDGYGIQLRGSAGQNKRATDKIALPELAEYPAFDLLQHFMQKLVATDPKFAALTQTPTRELANEAFHTILGRWARDEWDVEGVERVTAFADRVRRGLDQIVRDVRSGARIAVVTSAGPIGVAVGLTFGASEHHMIRTSIVIRNASITELRFRSRDFDWHPERVALIGFNQTHHLPAELHTEY
jgi:hypothetical protein